MKTIFDKCEFGNLTLKSRIIRTGLWESQQNDLNAIYDRYDKIASSGVGLIISELYSIYPKDKFIDHSFRMDSLNFMTMAGKIVEICHSYDVPILGQIEFIKYNRGIDLDIDINDLTLEDIRQIQSDIIVAVQKLQIAGFDGIQLALGNNFFLSKFINPYFNQRTDDYGGNTFNRSRIVLELIKVLKNNFKMHINCHVNAYDGRKGGINQNESIEICKLLEKVGCDSIQITRPLSPLYFTKKESEEEKLIDYSEKLISSINVPVILGGGYNNMNHMNELLNNTKIEYLSMYRPFIADETFLKDWKSDGEGKSRCLMCNNCYRTKTSTCYHF
ncbi:MAG: NADH-dependent flavin oxidoreductase [Methanobrevibacter sp.]|uniref:oxidoreductase n=1 Tax=Methanobrevibacter sp. TaxID=66852 RepID=UPI001B2F7477|nr:NADH-dependent flavin oxidoreductase [Methanobrevibacter sp.]MBO5150701.1 NADH-dependent flavin oxidoreductase [Methanobrevibacter sp.]